MFNRGLLTIESYSGIFVFWSSAQELDLLELLLFVVVVERRVSSL